MVMRLPNFLLIGANKAGTTSLYHYLKQHPEIYFSPVKEPMFFSLYGVPAPPPRSAPYMDKAVYDLESYANLFEQATTETALGEASTSYLAVPRSAATIKNFVPDVRLIAVLRDPAERAFSHYQMDVRMGLEELSFEDAVEAEVASTEKGEATRRRYVRYGMYGKQLGEYFKHFAPEQFSIQIYREFKRDPQPIIRELFRFLNVDESFVPDMSMHHNTATANVRPAQHANPFRRGYKSRLRRLVRQTLFGERIVAQNRGNAHRPALTREMRVRLREIFREDIIDLQELLGRDLKYWLQDG